MRQVYFHSELLQNGIELLECVIEAGWQLRSISVLRSG